MRIIAYLPFFLYINNLTYISQIGYNTKIKIIKKDFIMQHQVEFLNLVEELRPHVNELSVEQVKQKLDSGDNLQVIDVREDYEWQHGCVPNAIHLSKGVIERDIEALITDKQKPLVLYCSGGFRSIISAYNLQKMGYVNVWSMSGGLRNWMAIDYPIVPVANK